MTRRRRSSRSAACASSAKARPRSASQAALVELVEQHRGDALERRVAEDHAGEHALGDHLDARARAGLRLQPHAVADRLADPLAQRLRHVRRGGARGQPARLQHDDLAAPGPVLVQQGERDPGRLAGAGRGDEHGAALRAQGRAQIGNRLFDRQHAAVHSMAAAARRSFGLTRPPWPVRSRHAFEFP